MKLMFLNIDNLLCRLVTDHVPLHIIIYRVDNDRLFVSLSATTPRFQSQDERNAEYSAMPFAPPSRSNR